MSVRILEIDNCEQCKNRKYRIEFSDSATSWWREYFCDHDKNLAISKTKIPDECPLPKKED